MSYRDGTWVRDDRYLVGFWLAFDGLFLEGGFFGAANGDGLACITRNGEKL
jgi:hypothetical protein